MAETGAQLPTANRDYDTTNDWQNPNNLHANDAAVTQPNGGVPAEWEWYNFGFTGISGTIDGIEIIVDCRNAWGGSGETFEVWLSWDGGSGGSGTGGGSWVSAGTINPTSSTFSDFTLGGPTDTHGRSWAVDDFTNANFVMRFSTTADSHYPDLEVDAATVNVYFTADGGVNPALLTNPRTLVHLI